MLAALSGRANRIHALEPQSVTRGGYRSLCGKREPVYSFYLLEDVTFDPEDERSCRICCARLERLERNT